MKITSKEYFIPTIKAQVPIRVLGNGRTCPMLIRGVCTTTFEKGDYVVKYHKAPEMTIESSCRELIASFIAKELEMNVAEPVLVDVGSDFVETLRGKSSFPYVNKSVGLNFGSRYFGNGYLEFVKNQILNETQKNQAKHIFVFDVFISNSDRRVEKQNLLTDGDKIMIFDHELAFGFIYDIIKNKTPWIINDADKIWIRNHYFYSLLKGNENKFDDFIHKFNVIDNDFWDKVTVLIPKEWQTEQLEEIKKNLTSLITNKDLFLHELYKILS